MLWGVLALPAIVIVAAYARDAIGYGTALSESGRWAVWFLIATLAVSPLRAIMAWCAPRFNTGMWLRLRRPLGVAVFGYAALHLIIYAAKKADVARIISEGLSADIGTGWIALMIFAALAFTSTNKAVRRLGTRWKILHRSVYLASALTMTHWVMTAFDPTLAWIISGLIGALIVWRITAYKSYR